HVISVSPAYVDDLGKRYRWLDKSEFTVLPFGAAAEDYEFVHRRRIRHAVFNAADQFSEWVYGGAVAANMIPVLEIFLRGLAELKGSDPRFTDALRVHFVGTDYAPAGRTFKRVEPLARKLGLHDVVQEQAERLPYFEVLSLYEQSDAILLI